MRYLIICLSFIFSLAVQAQKGKDAAAILHDIQKLQVVGSALYLAAHPDDENTRLIAHLANERKVDVAYLSLTRGDGGQNLIGSEIRELLGVIRTQELLAARRTDGGQQYFSRANDFGYSKNPEETFNIWNKEEVMADIIWTIRKHRPDIIVNRFSHDTGRKTHGHHTASAKLSHALFAMAADPNVYPEQLKHVKIWQPTRQFFNTSWWFYGSKEKFEKADKSKMLSLDVGTYYPLLGQSNNEIASESRSQHRCQGFGTLNKRGSQSEYLHLINGDMPKGDIFGGIDLSWNRIEGGQAIDLILKKIETNFDFKKPEKSLTDLLAAYDLIQNCTNEHWKKIKSKAIKNVIKDCLGLYIEANADDFAFTPDSEIELTLELTNRSKVDMILKKLHFYPLEKDSTINLNLANNQENKVFTTIQLPKNAALTNAYWLNEAGSLGMYKVDNQLLRGLPETPRYLKVGFEIAIGNTSIEWIQDIDYKWSDPAFGERRRPLEIVPPVAVNLKAANFIFTENTAQTVQVEVKAFENNIKANVSLETPEGWTISPQSTSIEIAQKGGSELLSFQLTPPTTASDGYIQAICTINEKNYGKALTTISYDHIPTQMVFQDAKAKAVKLDLKIEGKNIGYVMGAGDAIPECLAWIGYDVTILKEGNLIAEQLKEFDAIILGIRALNTQQYLKFKMPALLEYVEKGGNLIIQYNTSFRLVTDDFAPYPLELSRDRVTVEEAEVRILAKDHPVLNTPNKITQKDFEAWVQERGLYFPNKWDDKYTAILSSNDPGETPKNGGLLIAKHGEGHYIYTGYSWFRELPAGVSGAYRLFVNLISL